MARQCVAEQACTAMGPSHTSVLELGKQLYYGQSFGSRGPSSCSATYIWGKEAGGISEQQCHDPVPVLAPLHFIHFLCFLLIIIFVVTKQKLINKLLLQQKWSEYSGMRMGEDLGLVPNALEAKFCRLHHAVSRKYKAVGTWFILPFTFI